MRRACVVVVAALLAVVAGPAAADSPVPSWRPSGAPVDGGADASGAPALAAGRTYRDTVGSGGAKAYKVYLDAASSAYLSVFTVPEPRASVEPLDGIELELKNADDTLCDSYRAMFGARDAARPIGGYVTRGAGSEAECRSAGWYVLWVTRNGGSDSDSWPLEIRYDAEPGLLPGAGTPQPAVGYSTASPAPVTGTPRAVEGGTGVDDAAALNPGVWTDSVRPGQTRFYKVRLGWGQQGAFVADFAAAERSGEQKFGISTARVEMYSPLRGYVTGDTTSYTGSQSSAWVRTAPVSYGNRLDGRRAVAAARVAGWYYVAVSVDEKASDFTDGAVPLTLRVNVSGQAAAAPAYAGAASEGGLGDGGGGEGAHSVALRIVGYTGVGTGTALVLWLAAWTALARRRQRTVGPVS